MKRFAYSALVAAVVGLGAFALADAQDQAGQQPRWRGPGGRMGPPFVPFDDLTDVQREQIRTILEEDRQSRQDIPAGMSLRRQLHAELLADAPDEERIASLQQQIGQAAAESLAREVALQKRIAQVLTAEQRAKARERLAQAPERGRRRGAEPPANATSQQRHEQLQAIRPL